MPIAKIVLAGGLIDGSNTVFSTPEPYVPGSTAYILNGRIHSLSLSDSFGYSESDPALGQITVDEAPLVDDVVQIFYWSPVVAPLPTAAGATGIVTVRTRLVGVVGPPAVPSITGIIRGGGS
jgi:hypothetical protein